MATKEVMVLGCFQKMGMKTRSCLRVLECNPLEVIDPFEINIRS
jgi:hypothetical protein